MKALVQRVSRAQVTVGGELRGRIGFGMLVLLGVLRGDDEVSARKLAQRVSHYRFFGDEEGRMNRSALDVGAEVLVISQVTLAFDPVRGRRPSHDQAAAPERARELYRAFLGFLSELGLEPAEGEFGAEMQVELVNEGPVTILLEATS